MTLEEQKKFLYENAIDEEELKESLEEFCKRNNMDLDEFNDGGEINGDN